jgi:hypothetical protein
MKNQSRKNNEEFVMNLADNQVPEPAKAKDKIEKP